MSDSGSQWLKELNPEQLSAVTYGNGPLLIVAGAGTGKTKTLAYRVAYLISQGVAPERILLLTFTRRAAEEMLKRAASAISLGMGTANRVWGGTFHATANRLLRMYGGSAGLSPDFTIMDRSDAEDFLNVIRNGLSLSRTDKRFPRKSTCLDIYSRRVNGEHRLGDVLKRYFPWCEMWQDELKTLFRAYVERKQIQNVLDYDDLLLYWRELLRDDKMADLIGGRFEQILVDEYQDTNRLQAEILLGMRRSNKNITVVGDDAQSIYGFRCATVRNMLDFPSQFPGAKVVTLEQNYRSRQPILDTTNRVIEQAEERYSKELRTSRRGGQKPQVVTCLDETQQDDEVIRRVLEHHEQGIPLRKQAVLFRAASHSASLELALTRRNIPFRKYGGLRFLETAHIKDVVSVLRILENPRDEIAWFRVLQLLSGVGPVTAAAAIEHLKEAGFSVLALANFKVPPAAREEMGDFAALLRDLKAAEGNRPATEVDRILRFYVPIAKRYYDDFEPRLADIEHLGQIAARYDTRRQLLSELVLDPPISTGDLAGPPTLDEDWLVLSTIHSAKGLEWDVVLVIHCADGCLPSDMATGDAEDIQEELRLTYVSMTRARDFLYVLWPLRYYHKSAGRLTDNHSYAQLCRFLTTRVLATADELGSAEAVKAAEPLSTEPLDESVLKRVRAMWE
jgi:DNA helicase-2/ATP-dependent DNA helicase PcrA